MRWGMQSKGIARGGRGPSNNNELGSERFSWRGSKGGLYESEGALHCNKWSSLTMQCWSKKKTNNADGGTSPSGC